MRVAKQVYRAGFIAATIAAALGAHAGMVHDNPDEYRDRRGIVTEFTGIYSCNSKSGAEKNISLTITNWFGKSSAIVSDGDMLSLIFDNQITYLDGEGGGMPGKNAAGSVWGTVSEGWYRYRPAGRNMWGEAVYERYAVLDGFAGPDGLVRPCDRPNVKEPRLSAVYRVFPSWKDKEGNVSFASLKEKEIFKILPDREDGWDEEEDDIQWKPYIWTTDKPSFRWKIEAHFPTYWNEDGEIAFHTRSIPYVGTLAVWSCSFGEKSPEPGKEYYRKIAFGGTAVKNGNGGGSEEITVEASLGESLPPGSYTAYMEIRSDSTMNPPVYNHLCFDVSHPDS